MSKEKTKEKRPIRKPTMFEAQFSIWIMVALILVGMLLGMKVHVMMILAAIISMLMAIRLGYGWNDMENAISKRVGQLTPVLCNLWAIGLLVGSMMFSGTLPMLIYHGFNVVSPGAIYLTTCLVCMVMSVATGSSWSSAGTAGIVCMTLAEGLGANMAITAGAVICGAVFGDKLSPLSETTNLAPACARCNLYQHIGSMLYTTVPATVVGLVLFGIVGVGAANTASELPEAAAIMQEQLGQLFNFNILLLLPVVLIIVCALLKKPALPTLVITSVVSAAEGVIFQGFTLADATKAMVSGFKAVMANPEGLELHPYVTKLLERGGMTSMADVVVICFCGFALTSIMIHAGFVDKALEPLSKSLDKRWKAVLSAEVALLGILALSGSSYPGAVFVGEAWQKPYAENNIGRPALSRTIEDIGTCMAPLIPWGSSGAYYLATLGIAAWGANGYAFWSILPWACPIIALLLSIFGIGMFKMTEERRAEVLKELENESSISISDTI